LAKWASQIGTPGFRFKDSCVFILLCRKQYEILKPTTMEPILMVLDNISHRQMIPRQPVTTVSEVPAQMESWARGEWNRTKYMRIVRTDPSS
jgi:hypothetical protein